MSYPSPTRAMAAPHGRPPELASTSAEQAARVAQQTALEVLLVAVATLHVAIAALLEPRQRITIRLAERN